MSSILATATSSLLASQTRISAAASNIANATTPNYQSQDVTQTSDTNGAVSAQTTQSTRVTDVSLEQQFAQIEIAANQFTASATLIKAEKKQQGSLVDIFA